jgi:hypothetical protein
MAIGVDSRAKRILTPLAAYQELSEPADLTNLLEAAPRLRASEKALGIYKNDPASVADSILFTSAGLYIHSDDGSWVHVAYSDIERTIPPESKVDVTGFSVRCRDGRQVWVPVKGARAGKFYDAFEVARFLDRARIDVAGQ